MSINSLDYYHHEFDQRDLTDKYSNKLGEGGICNGLCIEFTRFELSNENKREKNFIQKLKNKINGKPENFIKRIYEYQQELQTSNIVSANETILKNIGEIDNFMNLDILGISFDDPKKLEPGHMIAISKIKDEKGNITGFKLFDPNFGLYEFRNEKSLDQGFNSIFDYLKKEYYKLGLTENRCCDLKSVVKEGDLHKKKQNKYLEGKTYCLNRNIDNQNISTDWKKGLLETTILSSILTSSVLISHALNQSLNLFSPPIGAAVGCLFGVTGTIKAKDYLNSNNIQDEETQESYPFTFVDGRFHYKPKTYFSLSGLNEIISLAKTGFEKVGLLQTKSDSIKYKKPESLKLDRI